MTDITLSWRATFIIIQRNPVVRLNWFVMLYYRRVTISTLNNSKDRNQGYPPVLVAERSRALEIRWLRTHVADPDSNPSQSEYKSDLLSNHCLLWQCFPRCSSKDQYSSKYELTDIVFYIDWTSSLKVEKIKQMWGRSTVSDRRNQITIH